MGFLGICKWAFFFLLVTNWEATGTPEGHAEASARGVGGWREGYRGIHNAHKWNELPDHQSFALRLGLNLLDHQTLIRQ